MNKVWFTSDTHFGSERTLELSKRPFKTVEEMDKTMINNWNKIVSKDDIVFHLGDFGDYKRVKELNGIKMLILGNYEEKDNANGELSLDGFDKCLGRVDQVYFGNKIINLAHEPSKIKNREIDNKHVNLFVMFINYV